MFLGRSGLAKVVNLEPGDQVVTLVTLDSDSW